MPQIQVGPPILTINQGDTYVVSHLDGAIDERSQLGFFSRDTRFLSSYQITINRKPWEFNTSANLNYYAARIILTNPKVRTAAGTIGRSRFTLTVERTLGQGLHEDLDITNHGLKPSQFFLELTPASDFADIWDVRARRLLRRGEIESLWNADTMELVTSYRRDDYARGFSFRMNKTDSEARYANGRVILDITLEPSQSWHSCALWSPIIEGQKWEPLYDCYGATHPENPLESRQQKWRDSVTLLTCASEDVQTLYRTSVEDLGALRLYPDSSDEHVWVPAAGIPWYAALFGRDSLVTAIETMMVAPHFARGSLKELAVRQATDQDDWRDAEPGKILHELRVGELAHFNEIPQTPYYGTVDATPLFVITLHEAFQWLGDENLLHEYLDTARRALEWIDRWGDLDDDGFIEYLSRSRNGLRNQGWKDSGSAVVDRDGRQVEPPIALCEAQGYVFDAKLRMAEIEERIGDPERAAKLRKEAAVLAERFNETFWMEDEQTYAFALDREKRQAQSIASNPGHCLWSGIVPQERAEPLARRLLQEDMWCGWGIRTLSSENPAFNPLSYQRGSVWPHDNAIIAAGFARYGLRDQANQIARGMLDAASSFQGFRLPELFAGFPRTVPGFPVPYKRSNVPQAWAAGSVFFFIQTMLGLRAESGRTLFVDPVLPEWLPSIKLHRLSIGDGRVRLSVELREGRSHVDAEAEGPVKIISGRNGAGLPVRDAQKWE